MNITVTGNRLEISDIGELNAAKAIDFRKAVMGKIPAFPEEIHIDLATTRFVDSSGLGVLFAVYKTASRLNPAARFRIKNCAAPLLQLFELTQLHHLFEIVQEKTRFQSPA